MAGTGSARGGLGWVILVVALAVPSVLFYNWWSHLKADREKAVAAKARTRVPDGGVFQSSPNAKLVNPMTPVAASTAAVPVPAAAPAAPVVAAAPAAQAATIPAPAAATAAVSSAAVQAPAFSSSTAAGLPLKRDPMLSPFDQVRLIEEAEAKRKAEEDLRAMQEAKANRGKPRPPKAVDVTKLINLQGIVNSAEGGFKAIVNDEVLGAGETVGTTKVKILKITDQSVTFLYQGKKFSKGVSRD